MTDVAHRLVQCWGRSYLPSVSEAAQFQSRRDRWIVSLQSQTIFAASVAFMVVVPSIVVADQVGYREWLWKSIRSPFFDATLSIRFIRDAALPAVLGEHFAGGHWPSTFAIYLTSPAGLSR